MHTVAPSGGTPTIGSIHPVAIDRLIVGTVLTSPRISSLPPEILPSVLPFALFVASHRRWQDWTGWKYVLKSSAFPFPQSSCRCLMWYST